MTKIKERRLCLRSEPIKLIDRLFFWKVVIYVKWEIYKNLKFLRQEKNLTVDELYKLSGVSKAKILSIERELSFEHNIEDIARLALVLDVTVDDFVCQKFYEE